MPTDVVMPQMGESITEGTIARWIKKVGDTVAQDEPLLEISTDKVDAEIPAPVAGTLSEIRFAEGETVDVNTVIAVIGGTVAAQQPPAGQRQDSSAAKPAAPQPAAVPASTEPAPEPGRKLRSSPLVRRIAREHQVDLSRVRGTGSAGRITKDDILAWLKTRATAPEPAQIAAAAPAAPPHKQSAPPKQTPLPAIPGDLVPMSRMRAIIAERMAESMRIAPHVHSVYKIDMTRIARLRERARDPFEQRHGVHLTFMPFIAAAAVEALQRHPILNASLEGSSIRYHANIHLGIAVALEWGLIVPVIRQAEQRSFVDLARTIGDLAARARCKKLQPDESSGSTFTLTNSGVFGDEFGTPIINQPESAILAIGALKKEPVVLTDAEGNDTIAIRSMQHYCLGFDHRLIDGADAGKFMTDFKKGLENWDREIE
ncbi:MAG TPA: 2-oxoglutarate dehydrogenase, E2 component, dihydrolipoamide succinyltransferase [Terracidiphilus sp.]|nr:2-oxoglutarate dehydrogenase, E2 component, dihydrolipoamide succinyltransferase [Terracidiphilus sp.]